jgi:hypothetical protein
VQQLLISRTARLKHYYPFSFVLLQSADVIALRRHISISELLFFSYDVLDLVHLFKFKNRCNLIWVREICGTTVSTGQIIYKLAVS